MASLQGDPLPQSLPAINCEEVAEIQRIVREGVRDATFSSSHDVSDGDLLVAIAESCITGNLRTSLKVDLANKAFWFGEAIGAFVFSGEEEKLKSLGKRVQIIGHVTREYLEVIDNADHLKISVDALSDTYHGAIPQLMDSDYSA